jgi:hypothetical protein
MPFKRSQIMFNKKLIILAAILVAPLTVNANEMKLNDVEGIAWPIDACME